jgi:hypothetical protein
MTTLLENRPLDALLGSLIGRLSSEAARAIVDFRADPATQAHVDELAEKCNEGQLTEAESREYEAFVEAIDILALLQDQARAMLVGGR